MPFNGEPLSVDRIIAKRGMIRKGMFLTSDPYMGPIELRASRPDPDAPTSEELIARLAAVRKKIEDLKAGKLP
jgi:hypothetical protein